MPVTDDSATSRFDTPGEVGAIRIDLELHLEAVGAPVVADANRRAGPCGRWPSPRRRAGAARRCSPRTAGPTPGCRPACPSRAAARRAARRESRRLSARCSGSTRCGGVVLVLHLDDELRVVRLEAAPARPRTRSAGRRRRRRWSPTPAHRAASRLRQGARPILVGHPPDHRLGPGRGGVGRADGGILGQPHVDVRQVREILREELHLQLASRSAAGQTSSTSAPASAIHR